MWRKIIVDYRLQYLNDLFEINLIFYGLSRMLQFLNFLLIDATDRRLVAIKSAFLSHYAYTPFHFSRTLPLRSNFCSFFRIQLGSEKEQKPPFKSQIPLIQPPSYTPLHTIYYASHLFMQKKNIHCDDSYQMRVIFVDS